MIDVRNNVIMYQIEHELRYVYNYTCIYKQLSFLADGADRRKT